MCGKELADSEDGRQGKDSGAEGAEEGAETQGQGASGGAQGREELRLTKAKELDPAKDPLLRDILLHPSKSKVKITKKLLDKLEEEQWSG